MAKALVSDGDPADSYQMEPKEIKAIYRKGENDVSGLDDAALAKECRHALGLWDLLSKQHQSELDQKRGQKEMF